MSKRIELDMNLKDKLPREFWIDPFDGNVLEHEPDSERIHVIEATPAALCADEMLDALKSIANSLRAWRAEFSDNRSSFSEIADAKEHRETVVNSIIREAELVIAKARGEI